jgi:hypothetical protein
MRPIRYLLAYLQLQLKRKKYNGAQESLQQEAVRRSDIRLLIQFAQKKQRSFNYFHKRFREDMTIDCMYIARHGEPTVGNKLSVPWHVDDYAAMEITLNGDYKGGRCFT